MRTALTVPPPPHSRRQMGIEVVDTYSSGLRNPQLSADGVHFPGALSRQHAQAFLRAVCGRAPASDPLINNAVEGWPSASTVEDAAS